MNCNICGNEIPEGENFCPACGEPVGFEGKQPVSVEEYEPQTVGVRASYNDYNGVQSFTDNVEEPQFGEASSYTGSESVKKRSKAPLVIIIAAIVLIGAGVAAWFLFISPAVRASQIKGSWQPVVPAAAAEVSEIASGTEVVIDDNTIEFKYNTTTVAKVDYKLNGDKLTVTSDPSGENIELTFADAGGADLSKGESPFGDEDTKWYVGGDYLVIGKTVYKKK